MSRPHRPIYRHCTRRAQGAALSVLLALSAAAGAAETTMTGQPVGSRERFGAYEDSFAVWQQMQNNGWTRHDDWALRGHYSFKYTFCGPRLGTDGEKVLATQAAGESIICASTGRWSQAEFFVAYTGEFDFYAGTRRSDPVINRISAPGVFVRLPVKLLPESWVGSSWKDADGLEVGLQHRSDGQVTEVTSTTDAGLANEQYAAGNRAYFDTVSRGANYLSIAVDRVDMFDKCGLNLRTKLRLYVGRQDAAVTWGPRAGRGSRFSDYDRVLTQVNYRFNEQHLVDVQWRLGDRGLATDSWTLGWEWTLGNVPLYLRLHRGPMNTLSNYTQRQDSVAFGLRFARY